MLKSCHTNDVCSQDKRHYLKVVVVKARTSFQSKEKKCHELLKNAYLYFIYFIAKREKRQAKRKWWNTKLTILKDLYRKKKHKVSKLVHISKCKFYTVRIALASSSK